MNNRYGMAAALLMAPMLAVAQPSLELQYGTFYLSLIHI